MYMCYLMFMNNDAEVTVLSLSLSLSLALATPTPSPLPPVEEELNNSDQLTNFYITSGG